MTLTRQYMEEKILTVYNGPAWAEKLKRMGAEQIYAIYNRLLNAGRFNERN